VALQQLGKGIEVAVLLHVYETGFSIGYSLSLRSSFNYAPMSTTIAGITALKGIAVKFICARATRLSGSGGAPRGYLLKFFYCSW
jgi:hypothetical protein